MPAIDSSLLESFHQFVGKQLQSPTSTLTPDEVLELWHHEQSSIAAVRQGLAEVDAGLGTSLDEFESEIRQEFGFQALS